MVVVRQPAENRNMLETIRYIDDEKNGGAKLVKVGDDTLVGAFNFASYERERQITEMQMLEMALSGEKSEPYAHWSISWAPGEFPTREQVEDTIKNHMRNLGMSEHLAMWSCHDRDNDGKATIFHAHVLINRVNPEPDANGNYRVTTTGGSVTYRGRKLTKEVLSAHKAAAESAAKYGWEMPERACFDENGNRQHHPEQVKVSQGWQAREARTGEKSKARQLAEESKRLIDLELEKVKRQENDRIKTIQDLQDRLAAQGVLMDIKKMKKNGREFYGATLSGTENGEFSINTKLSALGKGYSIAALEKELVNSYTGNEGYKPTITERNFYKSEITVNAMKTKAKKIISEDEGWGKSLEKFQALNAQIVPSGGGANLVFNDGKDQLKLSQLGTSFKKLEEKWGKFENHDYSKPDEMRVEKMMDDCLERMISTEKARRLLAYHQRNAEQIRQMDAAAIRLALLEQIRGGELLTREQEYLERLEEKIINKRLYNQRMADAILREFDRTHAMTWRQQRQKNNTDAQLLARAAIGAVFCPAAGAVLLVIWLGKKVIEERKINATQEQRDKLLETLQTVENRKYTELPKALQEAVNERRAAFARGNAQAQKNGQQNYDHQQQIYKPGMR